MELSTSLIKEFASLVKQSSDDNKESTVYGTVVEYNGKSYARIDGSSVLTPIATTAGIKNGERVIIRLKNHTATVTGNTTSPSASAETVSELVDQVNVDLARIGVLEAEMVSVNGKLSANQATIDALVAYDLEVKQKLTANEAKIEDLEANTLTVDEANLAYAKIGDLEAIDAHFAELEADYGSFKILTAQELAALDAIVKNLNVENLDAKFANIDFTNIGEAAIREFFTKSGMIENVIIGDATVTGSVVGVTIKGDLIEAGTIKADKLVIRSDKDGLYYKLNIEGGATVSESVTEEQLQNGLSGSVIIAQSITAEKVHVDDLVAFGATIGGMTIDSESIHSMAKSSVDSTVKGFFFGADGQFAVGNNASYLKFYLDETDNEWKLTIAANDILLTTTSLEDELRNLTDKIDGERDYAVNIEGRQEEFEQLVKTYFDFAPKDNAGNTLDGLMVGKSDSPFKTLYGSSKISFYQGAVTDSNLVAYIQHNKLYIQDAHFIHGITFGDYDDGSNWAIEVDDYGWGISWREGGNA